MAMAPSFTRVSRDVLDNNRPRELLSHAKRSLSLYMKVGSHVSIEGGVSRAVINANLLGNTAFAMWLKNARGWKSKPYEAEEIERFREGCRKYNYDPSRDILPHASYMINLANPDPEKAGKNRDGLLDELRRCEQLGIHMYNIHPGSTLGGKKQVALEKIASAINWAHGETQFVKIVLENMAGDPNRIVGADLSDLAHVISLVKNKDRVGVCIDTCHTLAAGWDLTNERGFSHFWNEFDTVVGRKYLSAIHVNDSCWPRGSRRDQHASVGTGFCGPSTFWLLMNQPEFADIPKILETPTHEADLAVLKSFVGKTEDEALSSSQPLIDAGTAMRDANQKKTDQKREKEAAKGTKKRASLEDFKVVRRSKAPKKEET